MSCAIPGCSNSRRFKPDGISFHTFPRGELLKQWLNILGKDPQMWTWSKNKLICSKHFQNEDFIIKGDRRSLKINSVPNLINVKNPVDENKLPINNSMTPSPSEIEVDLRLCVKQENDEEINSEVSAGIKLSETRDLVAEIRNSMSTVSKRRKIEFIEQIHSYSKSQTIEKRNIERKMRNIELKNQRKRILRKFYLAKKKFTFLKQEIASLSTALVDINSEMITYRKIAKQKSELCNENIVHISS